MTDMVPEMLEGIEKELNRKIANDNELKKLNNKLREGTATYEDANAYAERLGKLLSNTLGKKVNVDMLPDGRMYFNIADRLMGTLLDNAYNMAADYSQKVQSNINKSSGYGLAALPGEANPDRRKNYINKISDAEDFEDVQWMMGEAVVNYTQAAVTDTIKRNAEFQSDAGAKGTIERILAPNCCEWCEKMAGVYSYPNVPDEVYMKHKDCACELKYTPKSNPNNQRIIWGRA